MTVTVTRQVKMAMVRFKSMVDGESFFTVHYRAKAIIERIMPFAVSISHQQSNPNFKILQKLGQINNPTYWSGR
jgi:hypothetical protein